MFETVAMAEVSASAFEAKTWACFATVTWLSTPTSCSTWPSRWRMHWPKAATARRCRPARSRSPAMSAPPRSRLRWPTCKPATSPPHDVDIATRIADTLCGGVIERGSTVDEEWLLALERKHFVELAKTEKTQARIAHTMSTGKPLSN